MEDRSLVREILASIVVFLVALPLCMGIAIASGVPPAAGLATGIIGGIIVGMMSGSPLQVSGPAAGLAVIVFDLVQDHGIAMLGPILLMAGLVQLLAGVLKLGRWFRAISPAVVYGMLAGIGILIFAAQFHVMVDDKPRSSGISNLLSIPESIAKGVLPVDGSTHHQAAAIGLLTIAVILLWNQFKPKALKLVPGALVAALLATGASLALGLSIQRVNIPESFLQSFTLLNVSSFTAAVNPTLILAAVALALVASAETLLSAAAVDRMHDGPRTNYDKELTAQGIGNMLCGFIGALPMTGVIVRSSTNVQAGAKTRWSAVMHGTWILAFVLAFPAVLRAVPTAALAAILVYTGFKLVDISNIKKLREYGRFPLVIYAATVIGIVVTDLLTGVVIGFALSVAKVIYKVTHLRMDLNYRPEIRRADIHLEGALTFVRLPQLASVLDDIPAGTVVHLHLENLFYIDHSCMDLLRNYAHQQKQKGGSLEVSWDTLERRYQLDTPRASDEDRARVVA